MLDIVFKINYLKLYLRKKKKLPNLFFPRDYSEYIFRDIFFRRNDDKSIFADKFRVREYVIEKGLEYILPKLYGHWENVLDIDFKELPDKFALKCNHGCDMNIICSDKNTLDIDNSIQRLNNWLKSSHPIFYETHYFSIKPVVICEEFISDSSGVFPMDYKIHCAHGQPIYIQACYDRNEKSPGKRIIYDTNWNDLNFVIENDNHFACEGLPRPRNLEKMLEVATILSSGFEYVRVDLYDTGEKVLFGEVTLTPMGGWLGYFSQDALDMMGRAIRGKK